MTTGYSGGRLKLDKLETSISNINTPIEREKYNLGTIGGGNHFAELQKVDCIYAPGIFSDYQLSQDTLFLLVHSGSRGLGEAIFQRVRGTEHNG
ncbi:MAG: RNA-splicing ligase RtcB [Candidatus Erwinia impunctatus]|nr:RNA-splicing ligase RtcB [Culicoides impunctatus]